VRKVLRPHPIQKRNPHWLLAISRPTPFADRRVFTLTLEELKTLSEWVYQQQDLSSDGFLGKQRGET
ncbi:MAG: hypothetical protein ACTSW4_04470, partial [Candidatus Ranarchaeia archaeon]